MLRILASNVFDTTNATLMEIAYVHISVSRFNNIFHVAISALPFSTESAAQLKLQSFDQTDDMTKLLSRALTLLLLVPLSLASVTFWLLV